jgi:hypothetical protein
VPPKTDSSKSLKKQSTSTNPRNLNQAQINKKIGICFFERSPLKNENYGSAPIA